MLQAAGHTAGSSDVTKSLSSVKKLLKDAASHVLLKNGSHLPPDLTGNVYLIRSDSVRGLAWNEVSKEPHEIRWLKPEMIEALSRSLFHKVTTCH